MFKKKPAWQKPKEDTVEGYLVKQVRKFGGEAYKFTAPGRRNVPDRYCVFTNNFDAFVECKRPGGKLREGQKRECDRLSARGKLVITISTKEQVDLFLQFVKEGIDDLKCNVVEDVQSKKD